MANFRPRPGRAPILALDAIPSLTQLYADGTLSARGPAAAHHPHNARLNARIGLTRHDITRIAADGIVNAANESLLGGGGVDGAIHRGAGPRLLDACVPLNGCATGDAKVTAGFDLPAKKVVHTVGPIYYRMADKQRAANLLRSCYRRSLELGEQNGLRSLVFCPIATGLYGYPHEEAAEIAIGEVRRFFDESRGSNFDMVVFTNILPADYEPYAALLPKYFPPAPSPEAKKADTAAEQVAAGTQTEDDKLAALTDDEWVKIDESEIPKKASVEDADEE